MLQRLDRALGLVEDLRDVCVREVEHELQRQHLLLLGRQLLDHLHHRLAPDRLHRRELGGRLLGAVRLGHLLLGLPPPARAEVVHGEVVRDPEEPGGERRRLPAEPPDRLEHLQERLRRQVLGVVPVADGHVQVAVDAVEVEEVQLLERVAVAALRALDEPAHVRARRVATGPRAALGHLLRHRRSLSLRPGTYAAPNPTRLSRAKRFTYTTRPSAITYRPSAASRAIALPFDDASPCSSSSADFAVTSAPMICPPSNPISMR